MNTMGGRLVEMQKVLYKAAVSGTQREYFLLPVVMAGCRCLSIFGKAVICGLCGVVFYIKTAKKFKI